MESLYDLYVAARQGQTSAVAEIIERFEPLMKKVSRKNGILDKDCYQECVVASIASIEKFELRE